MLEDVGGCWRMLEDVGGCWRMLEDVCQTCKQAKLRVGEMWAAFSIT